MSIALDAIQSIPAGPWAVGVSGGADSVALLSLLQERPDLTLHVVHLNHETRGADSDADADFVRALAARAGLPFTLAHLSEVERGAGHVDNNPSARYRRARLALFSRVVNAHLLRGVILAHHADDQAETVLLRLLRGSAPPALGGIQPEARVGELLILHPLLHVRRQALRQWLAERNIGWREDATNASRLYLRNRVRGVLAKHPPLHDALIDLAAACSAYGRWLDQVAPRLDARFRTTELQNVSDPLARHAARRWLIERGVVEGLGLDVLDRLIEMCRDAATSARQSFPGSLSVCRRGGEIFAHAEKPA